MDKEYMTNDTYRVMFKDYPDVVTVEQMSKMLGISMKTAYILLRENKILHFRSEEPIRYQSSISCGTWKCCRGLLRRLLSAALEPVILDIVSDR